MNRMMVPALIIGFLCLGISIIGATQEGAYDNIAPGQAGTGGQINVNGTQTNVTVPNANEQRFSLFDADGLVALLIIAIGIAAVAGISFLGSGLSEFSQQTIFMSATYMGLWAVLSLAMYEQVQGVPVFGTFIWLVLTALYMFGVISEIRYGGA